MKLFVQILVILLGFGLPVFSTQAQTSGSAVGEWKVYLPNKNALRVAATPDRIYCVTETGFFYYDKTYQNLQTLSKLDGLHDSGVGTIAYDSVTSTLVVAYKSTNIDLIRGERIINVNDILRKSISGDKTINHIAFKDKIAYLSCSFGLVTLDLVKLEIKDTYFFQNADGSTRQVFASTTLKDQLFAVTSGGIMSAKNNRSLNLSDQKNWKTYTAADGLPSNNTNGFRTIASFNNAVYAGLSKDGLYKLNGTSWAKVNSVYVPNFDIYQLAAARHSLIITTTYNFMVLDAADTNITLDDPLLLESPNCVTQDRDGIFWVADYNSGLVRFDGKNNQSFVPNGPGDVSAFKLLSEEKSLWVMGGGFRSAGQNNSNAGFYQFTDGFWDNFNYKRFNDKSLYPDVQDLSAVVRNPVNGKLYMASYGYGVLEWEGPGKFQLFNNTNSPLGSALPSTDPNSSKFVRVSDLAADEEGNIWVANPYGSGSDPGVHVLGADGTWKTYSLGQAPYFGIDRIIIDDNGYKWMGMNSRAGGSGILVFDEKKNRVIHLDRGATTGNLPGEVTAMVKDKKGEIWVGTETGIAVFYNPDQVFLTSNSINASTPIINRRALLEGQLVKCITVDGANRKWVGTENGVWLFNAEGDEAILNFTTKNSLLLSDKIVDIAVNDRTGDVYIATEAGLVSYRAGVTVTTEKLDCANVFPNPVRPGFSGQISITGIANNGIVKITDISGTLVYETKALGGTALWSGTDYNGKRVMPGVYMVLSSNADGGDTCVSKVAIIE